MTYDVIVPDLDMKSIESEDGQRGIDRRRTRELRVRLPGQKWDWLERWRRHGVSRTYAGIILLALECFAEKQRQCQLEEARTRQLLQEVE